MTPEMKEDGRYNWKGQPERLVYIGPAWYAGDLRRWHQFAKVDAPGKVWCEVLDSDLASFEETPASGLVAAPALHAAIVKVLGNCSDMGCAEKAYIAEQVVAELAGPSAQVVAAAPSEAVKEDWIHPETLHQAEDWECSMLCLDDRGVPRADTDGAIFSLWGRILKFAASSSMGSAGAQKSDSDSGFVHPAMSTSSRTSVEAPANAPSAEGSAWRPIATAPKDGTVIFTFWMPASLCDSLGPDNYGMARFKKGEWRNYENDEEFGCPDFWMPLTPPRHEALTPEASPVNAAGTPATPERDDKTAPAPARNVEPNEQGDPA